jgi:hypothetical protein
MISTFSSCSETALAGLFYAHEFQVFISKEKAVLLACLLSSQASFCVFVSTPAALYAWGLAATKASVQRTDLEQLRSGPGGEWKWDMRGKGAAAGLVQPAWNSRVKK